MVKKIFGVLASLRTGIWLLFSLIAMLLYGSLIMPVREEFQALHTTPLFEWLYDSPAAVTWWLFGAIVILSLLTANTVLCSIESLLRKRSARNLLLVISPQVIHIGFLFVLLAHLLSSYDSFQGMGQAAKGTTLQLPNGSVAIIDDIRADIDPAGFINDWSADVRYMSGGKELAKDSMRPNSPSFYDGIGLYIKTVRFEPFPVALIQISRDPGAPWALVGGVLFLIGMTTLLVLKIRMEEAVQ
ncbi:MAG: cytochrome C biogenesis protein ResB [Nitrospirae bacterium]|nr:cytochrome C biogenesis protein ResB [Nitrospirota bacterium]